LEGQGWFPIRLQTTPPCRHPSKGGELREQSRWLQITRGLAPLRLCPNHYFHKICMIDMILIIKEIKLILIKSWFKTIRANLTVCPCDFLFFCLCGEDFSFEIFFLFLYPAYAFATAYLQNTAKNDAKNHIDFS
jgi:hypothetical protein